MSGASIPPITGLDHVLVAVRDLARARAAYARLGFTMTPRGRHDNWETANYCAMLAEGYIELIGAADPAGRASGYAPLDRFLARREGLLGIAFATDDAGAAFAVLARAGVQPEPTVELARDLELAGAAARPRFRLVDLPAAATPGLPAFLCQHLTPEVVRRPAWLDHANGARRLAAVTTVAGDPPAYADAYARLLGRGAVTLTGDVLTVRAGRTSLVFARPGDAARLYPDAGIGDIRDVPAIAAMTITVDDIGGAAAVLAGNGVAHVRGDDDALVVPPHEACGVVLEFTRAGGA